ncbi:MAG: glycosyltransferase [Gammaproteobacteria bacterium]|nr:MAG: glycosyltransferase [Gammaproteobacteria bacterium]TND04520.1 MAG: glycosyltransferase [Gammaproteobacteria bacterium]
MKNTIKKIAKRVTSAFGVEIVRCRHIDSIHERVISLAPATESKGNVLLAFVIEPFLRGQDEPVSNAHSHDWESFQMAQTLLELGYRVDVISYLNRRFVPDKHYSIFVAARTNFERLATGLNKDCIKIVHLDTAHWIYNNRAAYARLLDVQTRRRVTLNSVRIIEQNWALEHADYATVLGNDFTIGTYRYADIEMSRVPVSVPVIYDWPENKDFESCRKNFLWFGSAGFVHKGLDLVLEAFSDMPELHLTVCGPIDEDEKFKAAYFKELYETPNIHTHGWVDVASREFERIARGCVALVYPSCAEGGGSSALTCMHAGLIPIVSRESSVDIGDFGVILEEFTIDAVKRQVKRLSLLPADQCENSARRARDFARRHHTRDIFAAAYKKTIQEILNSHIVRE